MGKIGYCFTKEKAEKLVTEGLKRTLERRYGTVLVALDPERPIAEQEGPGERFDAIIHKVRNHPSLSKRLVEYARENPECLLLDRPSCIQVLDDRQATFVKLFGACADGGRDQEGSGRPEGAPAKRIQRGRLCIHLTCPRQALISLVRVSAGEEERVEDEALLLLSLKGLALPLIAKPKASGKHDHLYLIHDLGGLRRALRDRCKERELVTQEFINHSGVILKAYNFGKQVECEARRSFADISQRQEEKRREGEEMVVNVTLLRSVSSQQVSMDTLVKTTGLALDDLQRVAEEACAFVRDRLQLTMFNVDLAFQNQPDLPRSRSLENVLNVHVLDVNYMPGYHKLSNYEEIFGQFLGAIPAGRGLH